MAVADFAARQTRKEQRQIHKKGNVSTQDRKEVGSNIRKERQLGPRWLLHCSHDRQGISGKFTGKEKISNPNKKEV